MEKTEITVEELSRMEADSFVLVDLRDAVSYEYGHIPGAVNIPQGDIFERVKAKDKTICLYCRNGVVSLAAAEELCEKGFRAVSLQGGYFAWLRLHIQETDTMESVKKIEGSLTKKFHRDLFAPFVKAINEYDLLQPNDKVAVCISGGKDSMLMAKLFQQLHRHTKVPFELVFLVMDPGYSPENREIIERNAQILGVPITVFDSNIFENVFAIEKSPCYICARMRRGYLYSKAKELGCNKIALGHHYDDVIETILMGMLYGAQMQTMMPKVKSANFEGMELIRPMYLIREEDIKRWRDYNNLRFIQCACKFTDYCTSEGCKSSNTGSKRKKVKELIASLVKEDPQVEQNIFRSVENVNLNTVIAYKDKDGVRHRFDEDWDNSSSKDGE
ncbi:MAG: ATPase [Clostridia bacterium]|nr:ATPase [Clostridia bacterium]